MTLCLRCSSLRVLACCAVLAGPATSAAQTPPPPTTIAFEQIRNLDTSAAIGREWLLTLRSAAAPPGAAAPTAVADLPVPAFRNLTAARVRERDPQLTSDSLVVSALDSSGRIIDWQIVADPRIVRAETPGPDGVLSGQILTYEQVQFRVALNASDEAAQVVVYKPRWQGADWMLEPIAVARTR